MLKIVRLILYVALMSMFSIAGCTSSVSMQPVMSLAGSEWKFSDASNRYVQFGSAGAILGHGGCNRFGGDYSQWGEVIAVSGLASTRMMCASDVMMLEREFITALQQSTRIDASHLTLKTYDDDQNLLLDLQRSDPD